MGYGVYEEPGHNRWAGYMVPAECDWSSCKAEIDRGLGHKCQEHDTLDENDALIENEGCGLFFCGDHLYNIDGHEAASAKPDSLEWVRWMLSDGSWEMWRQQNPRRVELMRERVEAGT